jgi:phosphohistidine phosphatase
MERVAPNGERVIEPDLYLASAGAWIERLTRVPDETESVMVIGHNPALQQLVLALAGPDEQVQSKFATGALATLALDHPWKELETGGAKLTALVRPKDLR